MTRRGDPLQLPVRACWLSKIRLVLGLLLAGAAGLPGLVASASARPLPTSAAESAPVLEPGHRFLASLSGGQAHRYGVLLQEGQRLHCVVRQLGVDVMVLLYSPGGQKLAEMDTPTDDRGTEELTWVAEVSGAFVIEVRVLEEDALPGRYEIGVDKPLRATSSDRLRVEAEAWWSQGYALSTAPDVASQRRAEEDFECALVLARGLGAIPFESVILFGLASSRNALNDQSGARVAFQESLSLAQAENDADLAVRCLFWLGTVEGLLGNDRSAGRHYAEGLALARLVADRIQEGEFIANQGLLAESLGDKREALAKDRAALEIMRETRNHYGELRSLNNIGYVADSLGLKQVAIDAYREALELSRRQQLKESQGLLLANLARVYSDLGDTDTALDYLSHALDVVRDLGDRRSEAKFLVYLGQAQARKGNGTAARESFKKAIAGSRALQDRRGEARALEAEVALVLSVGGAAEAVDLLEEALAAARASGDKALVANVQTDRGKALRGLGRNDEALRSLEEALALRQVIGDRMAIAQTQFEIAQVERGQGRPVEAAARAEAALDLLESLRTEVASHDLRLSYFATLRHYYELTVDMLVVPAGAQVVPRAMERALIISERARARGLLDLLAESETGVRTGVDASLRERERDLQQRLAAQADRAEKDKEEREAGKPLRGGADVELLRRQFDDVEREIRASSPRYAQLTQPAPASLRAIQSVLDGETSLLEYFLGEDRSVLWVVTRASFETFVLPGRSGIEALARELHEALSSGAGGAAGLRVGQAATLARLLLPLAADGIKNRRLAIVADGALQYVPFAALPDPSRPAAETAPIAFRHEVVSLPSASVLVEIRRQAAGRGSAPRTLVVVADPVLEAEDPRLGGSRTVSRAGSTRGDAESPGRLPFSQIEARALLRLVAPKDRGEKLGFEASVESVRSGTLARYRLIHFATHGVLDTERPERSGLLLSRFDRQGRPVEGFLAASDIFNLDLSADLVVLSACRTALGKEIRGEGLVGLTRAFMYAGTPRVVSSLWRVDDAATAELMKRFYEGMLGPRKLRAAAALREAQLTTAKQNRWQDPYYWAAFVLQGEWR